MQDKDKSKDKDKDKEVVSEPAKDRDPAAAPPPLPWLLSGRLLSLLEPYPGNDPPSDLTVPVSPRTAPPMGALTLESLWQDIDLTCRQETMQLYESEGLGQAGIPSSLEDWLKESR